VGRALGCAVRLAIACMACFQEDGKPSDEATSVEMRDDGLYTVTCSRGHVTVTALQEQKFELLFDLGSMALLDGYPREAVSSMAAALERFYEYYVQVVCLKQGIPYESFIEAWKPVVRQSERQLGAFLFIYLSENKKPLEGSIVDARPPESPGLRTRPTWTEFRNNAIHKGYLPSTEEVLVYGDLVYQFIYRLIAELKSSCAEAMQKATFHHVKRAADPGSGKRISTMAIPTLINLVRDGPASSFGEALKGLERYKRWLYHRAQSK
jgi:hypothetical protein